MKKMLFCFWLLATILGGQALAADAQKNWEEGLTQFFKKKNMQMQSFEYAADTNTIVVKGVTGVDTVVPNSTISIEEIIFTEPNLELFSAQDSDVPLVAKSVDFNGIHIKLNEKIQEAPQTQEAQKPQEAQESQSSQNSQGAQETQEAQKTSTKLKGEAYIKHVSLIEWKQNLVLLNNQDSTKNPEGYYKAAMNAFVKAVVYNDLTLTIPGTTPQIFHMAKMELTDISPTKIASILLSNGVFRDVKQENVQEDIFLFDTLEATDVGTPTAEHLAFLHVKGADVLRGTASTEDIAKYNAFSVAFNKQSPRWQFTLKGLRGESIDKSVKKEVFAFKETQFLFFNDPESDAQMDISLKVLGASINHEALGLTSKELSQIPMLLHTNSSAYDFAFNTSLKTNKEYSTLDISLADPKGPSLKIHTKVLLPETKLSSLLAIPFDESMFMSLLMRSAFVEFSTESANVAWLMPNGKTPALSWDKEFTRLVYDHNTGTNVTVLQEAKGMKFDLAQLGEAAEEIDMVAAALGSTTLALDSKLALNVNTNGSPSLVSYDFDLKDQAALNASLDFILPEKKISELVLAMDPSVVEAFLMQGTVTGAQVVFTEQGALPRLLAFASKQIGQGPEVLIAMAVSEARKNLGQLQQFFTPTSIDAAEAFIRKPGVLTVKATAKQPLGMATMGLLGQPGMVTVDISSKEGVDIVQASTALVESMPKAPAQNDTKPADSTTKGGTQEAPKPQTSAPEGTAPTAPQGTAPVEKPAEKSETSQGSPKATENTAQDASTLVAPVEKKAGTGLIMPTTQDVMGLTTFAPDQKADSCVRVLISSASPLTAVRLESISGKIGSWKTKDVKNKAIGVLAVMKDGSIVNADDASFALDVTSPTTLALCAQDNGAIADPRTRLRVIFFHKDGSRRYSVIQR